MGAIYSIIPSLVLIGLCLNAGADAATVSIGASKDNSIFASNTNNSAGGGAGIFVGTNGQGSPRRGLIAFDIAAHIPLDATITSAELSLYHGAGASIPSVEIGLHRLLAEWGEGTAGSSTSSIGGGGGGFPASPGDATYAARFHGSTPWTGSGAFGDFLPAPSATATVGQTLETQYVWHSTPALVGDIQDWLNNSSTNFGWLLLNSTVAHSSVRAFYSSEATLNSSDGPLAPSWRPTLTVTYVPEPTGFALLLLGLLIIMLRERFA